MARVVQVASSQTWKGLFRARSPTIVNSLRCVSSVTLQTCRVDNSWQVSSHGRVCNTQGRISYGFLNTCGYHRVKMSGNDFYVHRLVTFAFLGPPPDEATWQVHHRDGNKANNSLDNLEYVTPSQNICASFASLSRRCGGAQRSVPVMWRAWGSRSWSTSPSMKQAAAELGMCWDSISRGCHQGKLVKGYELQLFDPGALEGEEWRQMYDPVSGLQVPGSMVSSLGRVKFKSGRISWGCLEKSGYWSTTISFNSITRTNRVHRLVAFAFLGPPLSKKSSFVNHKDLNKGNNAADNLEYVTCSENVVHWHANKGGSANFVCKAVESRALDGKDTWTKHSSISSTARALGMSSRSVSSCVNGHRVSACGHEFRLANTPVDGPAAKLLPGEEWRQVDVAALLREKDGRKLRHKNGP